jgi:hypothetical protein
MINFPVINKEKLMKFKLQIVFLVACFFCCCTASDEKDNSTTTNANIEKDLPKTKILELLKNSVGDQRNQKFNELMAFAKTDSNNLNQLTNVFVDEGKKICLESQKTRFRFSQSNFDKLRIMSDIFAEFKSIEGLEMLVDCLDYKHIIGGLSASTYATMPAIIQYKELAVPALKKKMSMSNNEVRCQIASVLTEVGSNDVLQFLIKVKENEKDEEVLDCLNGCISAFENDNMKNNRVR